MSAWDGIDEIVAIADAGSFVAARETPGTLASGQGPIGPHRLDAYRETAGMLDASSDPRMRGVRDRLGELARAGSVEVFTYSAARENEVLPSASYARGGGEPTPTLPYGAARGGGLP